MPASVTIKDIAKEAGVHFSTVSLALRNDPRLSDGTRIRIQKLADEMGYVPNAAMKALCAYRESNRPHPIRSGLAFLTDTELTTEFRQTIYNEARKQAANLGYNLHLYTADEAKYNLDRLRSIWWNSGLKGVLIGPFDQAGSILDDKWDDWICVAFGYSVEKPDFNRTMQDHFINMTKHLAILRSRGYKRIGLHLDNTTNRRTHGLLHGAYMLNQAQTQSERIPLLSDEVTEPAQLVEWISRYKLDLVIAGSDEYYLMEKTGLRMPEDIGFSLLSWKQYEPDNPSHCAGFDMKAEVLASSAISFLVSQIHENAYGLSALPKTLMVTGEFHDGDTIRPAH
ncbi:MAG: LacI family DNA-binding transcriptional regulator [Puniceicoccales bacterium]